ncbi:MAG: tetratricopeptide repeat protein [Enhydrobacter sp.]|nr:tetratricopeptide repeat protein [Enhydrobacter sp.]
MKGGSGREDPPQDVLQHELQQGLVLHRAGQLVEAKTIYQNILSWKKDHFDALYLLGLIAYQTNELDRAEELIAKAIELNGRNPAFHSNRGLVLRALRRLDEALASYNRAIEIAPAYAEAFFNRGNTLKDLGRFDEALASYDKAVAIRPAYAEAYSNRGNMLTDLGRLDDALASYDRAVAIRPDYADVYFNRGATLRDLERLDEALASYDRALEIKPDFAEAYCNRGNTLMDLGRFDEALTSCDRAIAIKPDYADARSSRGAVLRKQGRLDEAVDSFRQAIALKPDFAEAYNLGTGLMDLCRFGEAGELYEQALALDVHSDRVWRGLTSMLMYHPDLSPDDRFRRQQEFGSRMAEKVVEQPPRAANDRDPRRRLRIGWLSSDFREHPVGHNLLPFFEHRDRSRSEAICYAEVRAPDDMTAWFREHSDEWRSTVGLSDAAVAELIRADRIDVMIYLAGRFDQNRMHVAAWRAAPVQVSMFDVATSGLEAMDYLVADRLMVPIHGVERFTERLARLPNTYVHPGIDDAPDVVAPPILSNGYATFGCFNNPTKVNDRVLELWAKLLARVPESRLVLKYRNHYQSAQIRDRIEGIMSRHGIERSRLELGGEPEAATPHLARYGGVDIALDPFPFNGSTTTFEALWMGVPVVTLEGNGLVSRWSSAQLQHVGLDELVARTPEDYVGFAAALAGDCSRLAGLRSELRQRVLGSALCNGRRTNRYLERALRAMWRAWCDSG